MKHIIITTLLLLVAACSMASAQETYEMKYKGSVRTYCMYIPQSAKADAPLIVYTHGYGAKKSWRENLNAAAERHGFAVCYPMGSPDVKGKLGWFVAYPSQSNMDRHEEKFLAALLKEVCKRFNLSRENVFLTGMSNGGDLCYQIIYTKPDLFKAYASVAGLTFEYAYKNKLTKPVSLLEIHGNNDHTSMWTGDHENTGGWGPYIPVPLAVAAIAANNRCTTMSSESIPSLSDPARKITITTYDGSPSGKEVVLYEVDGGTHCWHDKDIDTGEIILRFFESTLSN
ncbi:MAG: alpha/beta hydrolase-fold protein [Bacteroidales bacterium]|jgi:polyhydroxybutyrate depolymerase|nr:alpha/beta hydrolase-fold protein [Bacteroidales bacterium]MCI2134388.1 alpha/beta hydrolase-fold protein [Bacteroidales bacterium]